MSVFDLDTRGRAQLDETARMNPLDLSQVNAGFWEGAPKGVGMGVMRGAAAAARATDILVSAPVALYEQATGQDGKYTDNWFRAVDDNVGSAVDYWTPTAQHVGTAGRVLGGLSEIVPQLMATGGNPALMLASQTTNPAADLAAKGVDANLATTLGLIQGSASAVGFRMPFLGETLASRMLSGVAGNLATNAGATALQHDILDYAGRQDLAAQYNPLDVEARAVDVLTGLAFGGMAHVMAPSSRAAVAAGANAKHFQADTAPGRPADLAAHVAHQEAIEQAVGAILRGEPVVPPPEVSAARFEPVERPVVEVPQELRDIQGEQPLQLQIPKGEGLTSAQQEIDARFRRQIGADPAAAEVAYSKLADSMGGKVLNTDTARELSADYLKDRSQSAAVHEPASALIKWLYARRLAEAPKPGERPLVLFSAGGTGAGKTVGIRDLLPEMAKTAQIVYDTNMNGLEGSIKKVDQALAAGKEVHIVYTFRDPVEALKNGALTRAMGQERKHGTGRTVPLAEHIRTHTGSAEVVRQLQEHYANDPRVNITAIDNSRGKGKAVVASLADLPTFPPEAHNSLREQAHATVQEALQSGAISERVARGFIGEQSPDHAAQGMGPAGDRGNRQEPQPQGDGRRVDPVVSAAREAALSADLRVPTGEIDAEGNPVTVSAAELLARSDAEIAQAQKDATGFEAAVNCFLSTGVQ